LRKLKANTLWHWNIFRLCFLCRIKFSFRCFSSVGRSFWSKGYQIIGLSKSCLDSPGTIMHEILHALGFWHEQSRPDRDQNIEIMWENIAEGECW